MDVQGDESATSVFDLRQVSKTYRMGEVEVPALSDVTLLLPEAEFVALLGPSGSESRRSSTSSAASTRRPSGEVFYREHRPHTCRRAALTEYRRRHVGFVFQFYNLIPSLTAVENVALVTDIANDPLRAGGCAGPRRPGRAPTSLSGAACQAASNSAWRSLGPLPSGPRCCSATSRPVRSTSRTGVVVLEALERVNRELGTTTVVITHNAAISGMADRVVRLADGRVRSIERRHDRKVLPRELSW